jgi:hypothetical protein
VRHKIHSIAGHIPVWHSGLDSGGSRRLRELMGKINAHAAKGSLVTTTISSSSGRTVAGWTATADQLMAQLYALEAEARK